MGQLKVGDKVFIRGNFAALGRLLEIHPTYFVVTQYTWVADTGRFGDFLANGSGEGMDLEIAPADMVVNIERPVYDVFPWPHPLPEREE